MKVERGKWVPEAMPYDVGLLLDRVDTYSKGPKAIAIPEVDDSHDIYYIM